MSSYDKVVTKIVKGIVPAEKKKLINPSSRLREDLDFDSLSLMNLILKLEESIGFDIADSEDDLDFTDVQTLQEIIEIVKKLKREGK